MDIRQQVGENVKRIRKGLGWSQEDLALESDLHRTYLSGVERGVRNPTVMVLQRIADALEVEPVDLLHSGKPSR